MGKGRKRARGYTLQSGPEGPSWCRSRSRSGRSKTTMHQVRISVLDEAGFWGRYYRPSGARRDLDCFFLAAQRAAAPRPEIRRG